MLATAAPAIASVSIFVISTSHQRPETSAAFEGLALRQRRGFQIEGFVIGTLSDKVAASRVAIIAKGDSFALKENSQSARLR